MINICTLFVISRRCSSIYDVNINRNVDLLVSPVHMLIHLKFESSFKASLIYKERLYQYHSDMLGELLSSSNLFLSSAFIPHKWRHIQAFHLSLVMARRKEPQCICAIMVCSVTCGLKRMKIYEIFWCHKPIKHTVATKQL